MPSVYYSLSWIFSCCNYLNFVYHFLSFFWGDNFGDLFALTCMVWLEASYMWLIFHDLWLGGCDDAYESGRLLKLLNFLSCSKISLWIAFLLSWGLCSFISISRLQFVYLSGRSSSYSYQSWDAMVCKKRKSLWERSCAEDCEGVRKVFKMLMLTVL